ncbi:monocarboxylate transporter 14 [Aplysia californica]|uniref:Monocarboxylate transporter 14 n=1 Tax=Aplysia californica TaxID=6500 RepID=A0ABM0JMQ6_APLCA|nr:monocarboxylate transporter 14 [Aplysia californica]
MEGGIRGVVIVFAALMVQVLAFGNYACIGIYTVHLLDVFDNDAVSVSLISAIHFAVLLCCGPLASFLMTRITYRKLSLIGASLVVVGMLLTPLIVSVPAMCVFFGVIAGLGGCLIYLPSHVLSGMYYDKYRSLATGVATAGTALGATIMPLIVGVLIEEYTWRGSLVIVAGIDAHLFIFALLMLPPPNPSNLPDLSASYSSIGSTTEDCEPGRAPEKFDEAVTEIPLKDNASVLSKRSSIVSDSSASEAQYRQRRERHDSSGLQRNSSVRSNSFRLRDSNASYALRRQSRPRSLLFAPTDDISRILAPSYIHWSPFWDQDSQPAFHFGDDELLHDIPETEILSICSDSADGISSNDKGSPLSSKTTQNTLQSGQASMIERNKESFKEQLKKHIAILTDFRFAIYFVSTIIWSLTTTMFFTFGPELIVIKGYSPQESAFVFTFFGVGQLVGCIIISILGNLFGRRIIIYVVTNILTGVFLGVVPLAYSFVELSVVLVLLGLAYGGILALYMSVMVDLLGVADMEVGLGYVLLASGLGCFSGPPLGGVISQAYGGYDEGFYLSGVLSVIGGVIMGLLYVPACRSKTEHTDSETAIQSNKSTA